jgi:hypothetical protein
MTAPRRPLLRNVAATAVVVGVVVLAGCGVPDDQLTRIDRSDLPEALREPATTTTSAPEGAVVVAAVHWVRGQELVPETVLFEGGPDAGRLLALLERGPAESDDGLRSSVQEDLVVSVDQRDDVVQVELGQVDAPDQVLGIGQLVLTLTSLPEVRGVRIVRDGEPVEVPLPDGTLVRRTVRAEDYSSLLGSSSGTRR